MTLTPTEVDGASVRMYRAGVVRLHLEARMKKFLASLLILSACAVSPQMSETWQA